MYVAKESELITAQQPILVYNGSKSLFIRGIVLHVHDLPSAHGAYVLQLWVSHSQSVTIGRLGQYQLPAGYYFYVGSARGSGGLRSRVGRHLRGGGPRHWHVDYVRAVAEVQDVFYTVTDKLLECVWSQTLQQLPRSFIPVPHFGSSDCSAGCAAHLTAFPHRRDSTRLAHLLEQAARVPVAHFVPPDSDLGPAA